MTKSRSSVSKKQVAWEWSAAEDSDLLEACKRFGGQWQEVEKFVGRSRVDCMERWEVVMPLDWKSFSMLSWPDEDILRLMQAVRSSQYDNEKRCFVSTKECDWSVIATILNVDDWRWDPADCEQAWGELQCMKPFRLGDFSKLEDEILAERVAGWGRDQRGLWRWLGDILKRDHTVLRSRWNVIKKDYNNYESSHQRSSEGSCLYGSALLSSLGPAEQEGHSEACNSLWSSPVAYNPGSQGQLTALPGFTPSEAFAQHMNSDNKPLNNDVVLPCSRMLDTSFDSARSAPASGRSSKSSRLIDLSFFSSRSFSDHDADSSPTARRVRQKILPSLKYGSSSESENCTYVKNPSTRQSTEPVVGPVKDSLVESGKRCSVEQARDNNTDNSRWYEVIDLSHEDTAALEEDLVQIACHESVSQQSSTPAQSQSAHHNVRSTTKDANTSTGGASPVHSLREAPVPENMHKEVQSSEQETPEEEILLALFNSMSEDPTEATIDTTNGLPTERTISNIPSTSNNANFLHTPFAFDTNSGDHADIAGGSLYGGVPGFGTVSTLGAAGSDASHGVNNNGAFASSSVFAMAGTSADIRATRNTLSSDEAAVTVADTTGLKHISSGIASNDLTQSSDRTNATTVSVNPSQEPLSTRSLFNSSGPLRFVCGTSSIKGSGFTSVTGPSVPRPSTIPNSLFRKSNTVTTSINTTCTTTTLTTTSTTVSIPTSTNVSTTITAPTATPTTSIITYTEPVHSTTATNRVTTTSSSAPANHTCGNFNHYSYESYCDGLSPSSAALDEKIDDSTYTEQVLVDLAKQASEREAQDLDEALQLSLRTSLSNSHHSVRSSQHSASNNYISRNSNCSGSSSSSMHSVSMPIAPAPSLTFVPDHVIHPFRTEEELIHLALEASLQDSDHTVPVPTSSTAFPTYHNNDAYNTTIPTAISCSSQHDIHATNDVNNYSRLPVGSASDTPADRLTNFDAPYVNFATGSDNYWEDNDEELIRAIERSLHET